MAVPFIRVVNEKKCQYELCPEAFDIFEDVKSGFGVVVIVGKYRTGKSYFMNECLLRSVSAKASSNGFSVGNTVQACTKGLWCHPVPLTGGTGMPIYVFDTEGIGALDASNNNDIRIFSMALLLSSFFIYNSLNAIDEDALNQLSLVTNVCKQIKIKEDEEASAEELGKKLFPPLLWMVRDFSLQLKDEYGNDISADQYLDNALTDRPNDSSSAAASKADTKDNNRLRKCIRDCFPRRSCATIIRPCNDEYQLQMLQHQQSSGSSQHLKPMFRQQLDWIRSYIIQTTPAKTSHGNNMAMTGKSFLAYAVDIVESINRGEAPVIRNSWSMISELHCRDAADDSYKMYQAELSRLTDTGLPETESELLKVWKEAKCVGLSNYRLKCAVLERASGESGTPFKFKDALLKRMEDDKERWLEEVKRAEVSAVSLKIAELDSAFSADSVDSKTLDRLEKDLTQSFTSFVNRDTDCRCGSRAMLTKLTNKCWKWMRILGSSSFRMETVVKNLENEKNSWIQKYSEARDQHKDNLESEQKKFEELNQKLSSVNDVLSTIVSERESEITVLEERCKVMEEMHKKLQLELQNTQTNEDAMGQSEERSESIQVELLEKKLAESEASHISYRSQLNKAQGDFLEEIKKIRSDTDNAIEQITSECQRKVTHEKENTCVAQKQNAELMTAIREKELCIEKLKVVLEALEDKFAEMQKSRTNDMELYRKQWEKEDSKRDKVISDLQSERITKQLEYSEKLREFTSRAATMEARANEYKRRLDKIDDPTKLKKLKSQNDLLRTSLAKSQTENEWLNRSFVTAQTQGEIMAKKQDELWAKYFELQREKETEVLNLILKQNRI